jgi:hypothetical protein
MDAELMAELDSFVSVNPEVRWLEERKAISAIEALANRFEIPRTQVWWWEGREHARKIQYSEVDGLAVLEGLVVPDSHVLLLVTDDEPPPWPSIEGPLGLLMALVRKQRYFEFFVTDPGTDWVVFDTHHNELVILGKLPGPQRGD